MTSSQYSNLNPTTEAAPEKRFNIKKWFTPTTIVVSIATGLNMLGVVMILGSMQQIYRQLNTLTDFTGNCIMHNYVDKNTAPQSKTEPPTIVVPPLHKQPLIVKQSPQAPEAVPDKKPPTQQPPINP